MTETRTKIRSTETKKRTIKKNKRKKEKENTHWRRSNKGRTMSDASTQSDDTLPLSVSLRCSSRRVRVEVDARRAEQQSSDKCARQEGKGKEKKTASKRDGESLWGVGGGRILLDLGLFSNSRETSLSYLVIILSFATQVPLCYLYPAASNAHSPSPYACLSRSLSSFFSFSSCSKIGFSLTRSLPSITIDTFWQRSVYLQCCACVSSSRRG